MKNSETSATNNSITRPTNTTPNSSSSPSPSRSPSPRVVTSPCAACKMLRRRCADKCLLAPYFPPTEPTKFAIAHRVFGASNIIKFLQEVPESQRADAVSSMVYEASFRIRDPIYGCAGAICKLQKQINELQAQLAKSEAQLFNMQCQQANILALICKEVAQWPQQQSSYSQQPFDNFVNFPPSYQSSVPCILDEENLGTM